jgi:hypothetical protein
MKNDLLIRLYYDRSYKYFYIRGPNCYIVQLGLNKILIFVQNENETNQMSREWGVVDSERWPLCQNGRIENCDAKSEKNDASDATNEPDSEASVPFSKTIIT